MRQNCLEKPKLKWNFVHSGKVASNPINSGMNENDNFDAFAASVSSLSKDQCNWIINSGASRHMTCKRTLFENFKELAASETVSLGDGRVVEAVGSGNMHLNMIIEGKSSVLTIELCNVLFVPKLTCNFFSVSTVVAKGYVVQFDKNYCHIYNKKNEIIGQEKLMEKLYHLCCQSCESAFVLNTSETSELDLWHHRLGHLNGQMLKQPISKRLLATGITAKTDSDLSLCESCVEGNMHRKPFKSVGGIESVRKLELVHSDVCRPMEVESQVL